jgi:hypothetical protein
MHLKRQWDLQDPQLITILTLELEIEQLIREPFLLRTRQPPMNQNLIIKSQ